MPEILPFAPPDANKSFGVSFARANIAYQAEKAQLENPEFSGNNQLTAEHAGHLALDSVGIDEPEQQSNLEMYKSLLTPKEQEIFAPYDSLGSKEIAEEVVGETNPQDTKYDNIYSPDFEFRTTETRHAGGGDNHEIGTRHLTEAGEQFGVELHSRLKDSLVVDIINERSKELKIDQSETREVMRMIREDTEVRYALAASLLRKLGGLVEGSTVLPARVGGDDEKLARRSYGGHKKMPSRDYAVCLALSFLDGTFEPRKVDWEALKNGFDPIEGEHRFAAAGLLTNNWDRPK